MKTFNEYLEQAQSKITEVEAAFAKIPQKELEGMQQMVVKTRGKKDEEFEAKDILYRKLEKYADHNILGALVHKVIGSAKDVKPTPDIDDSDMPIKKAALDQMRKG